MEEEYVYNPKSHMITKEDRWTLRYKKCKAMKEDDHSRTNLAHNADCRARLAEFLVDDVAFRTKMRKAVETKRRTSHHGLFPKVQVGGTGTKRCRDNEDLEEEQVFKVSVGLKKERNDSSSNSSSSNSVEQFF